MSWQNFHPFYVVVLQKSLSSSFSLKVIIVDVWWCIYSVILPVQKHESFNAHIEPGVIHWDKAYWFHCLSLNVLFLLCAAQMRRKSWWRKSSTMPLIPCQMMTRNCPRCLSNDFGFNSAYFDLIAGERGNDAWTFFPVVAHIIYSLHWYEKCSLELFLMFVCSFMRCKTKWHMHCFGHDSSANKRRILFCKILPQ